MSALDQIIDINITQQTAAVSQPSFSIPLIIGPTVPTSGSDVVNAFSEPSGMLGFGYTVDSPEYILALELFEQPLTPTQFFVGVRQTPVDQVDTIAVVTATVGHVYEGLIQGEEWSYTAQGGDTQSTIATAIAAAINGLSNPTWNAVASGASVTVTSTVPGLAFTDTQVAADPKYTITNTTPNYGIKDDIAAIQAVNDQWYGVAIADATDADILQAAAAIEALVKIYIAVSSTSAIATTSSTDVGSVLKSKSYKRTALIYTPEATEGKDAAWLGGQLPQVPGSNTWAFKTLFGCTEDVLSAAQQAILFGDPVAGTQGKNVNVYQLVGGVGITQMGTMAGGQFIDITVGIDWLKAEIQTNIYSILVNSAKVPYTDVGVGLIISAVRQAIDQGVVNGLIDGNSPISVTAPSVLSVPANQRAQRIAPTISFSCRLAGALHAVVVNGTVTV